jgi:hypothetical protein
MPLDYLPQGWIVMSLKERPKLTCLFRKSGRFAASRLNHFDRPAATLDSNETLDPCPCAAPRHEKGERAAMIVRRISRPRVATASYHRDLLVQSSINYATVMLGGA